MTDQELKDLVASLAIKSDRLDASIAEMSAAQKLTQIEAAETQRVIKELGRRMGSMPESGYEPRG